MTDQEIIKALKCKIRCFDDIRYQPTCNICNYKSAFAGCMFEDLFKDTIDLITRQQAEIEKLQEILADALESLRLAAEANKDLQAKIEGLEAEIKQLRKTSRV